MQELEKILEEIKEMLEDNKVIELNSDGTIDKCVIDAKLAWDYIKDIISKRMNDGRIPAKEKPAEDGFYAATMSGTLVDQEEPFVGLAEFEDGNWVDGDDVIAWRPLPEPYRAENKTEASDWRQDMLRKFDRRE